MAGRHGETWRTIVRGATRVVCDPAWAAWLEERGYLEGREPPDFEGREVFFRSERRSNAVVTGGPGGAPVFEKWLKDLKRGDLLRHLCQGRATSAAMRELLALRHARRRGLLVPRPIAAGERRERGAPRETFLITERLAGRSLAACAAEPRFAAPPVARDLAVRVGAAVRALHDAGIGFASLAAKHVWVVGPPDRGPAIGFLDLADGTRGRPVGRRVRARDLGWLAATLGRFPVSATLRLRALRAYLERPAPLGWNLRDAWRLATRAAARLAGKRRYRRFLATAPVWSEEEVCPAPGLWTQGTADPEVAALLAAVDPDAAPGWTAASGLGSLPSASAFGLGSLPSASAFGLGSLPSASAFGLGSLPSASAFGLALFSGPRAAGLAQWNVMRLLRAFGLRGPEPVALRIAGDRAVLAARPRRDAAEPLLAAAARGRPLPLAALGDLALELFAAGIVPGAGFLDHLALARDGGLVIGLAAPLELPPELSPRQVAGACALLEASLREAGAEPAAVTATMARVRSRARRAAWPYGRPRGLVSAAARRFSMARAKASAAATGFTAR